MISLKDDIIVSIVVYNQTILLNFEGTLQNFVFAFYHSCHVRYFFISFCHFSPFFVEKHLFYSDTRKKIWVTYERPATSQTAD